MTTTEWHEDDVDTGWLNGEIFVPVEGPPGPTGPAGPTGPTGPAGPAGGSLLGHCYYNPSISTDHLRSSTTFAALDTTNLRATFVAPASGAVLCVFGAFGSSNGNAGNGPNLAILNGSTVMAQSGYNGVSTASASTFGRIESTGYVTGLTPGNTYNFDLGWASSSASANIDVIYGQGYAGGNAGDAHGPAYIFITAA